MTRNAVSKPVCFNDHEAASSQSHLRPVLSTEVCELRTQILNIADCEDLRPAIGAARTMWTRTDCEGINLLSASELARVIRYKKVTFYLLYSLLTYLLTQTRWLIYCSICHLPLRCLAQLADRDEQFDAYCLFCLTAKVMVVPHSSGPQAHEHSGQSWSPSVGLLQGSRHACDSQKAGVTVQSLAVA